MRPFPKNIMICPYWSSQQTRCRAQAEGLLIPLDAHVVTYCTSIRHSDCPHFRACPLAPGENPVKESEIPSSERTPVNAKQNN